MRIKDPLTEDSDPTPTPLPREDSAADSAVLGRVKTIHVLVVEDSRSDADLLRRYLELAPVTLDFKVDWATRLLDGQAKLASNPYDVVVVDLSLPDSHGLDTFRRLRDQMPTLPIVVMTGNADEELALEAVRQGAADFLVKGTFSPNVLTRSLRYAIERSRRRHAERALHRLDAKLLTAQKIQQKLLPAHVPQLAPATFDAQPVAYDINGASFAADTMAGDYFDYIPMLNGALGLAVGDVSGHGFGPALLMVETRASLRVLAQTCADIPDIWTMTNRVLVADMDSDHYVTLFLAKLDVPTGMVTYVSAGHPSGFHLDSGGRVKRLLASTTLPLGVKADTDFSATCQFRLAAGDMLVLLTDGVLEARGPHNAPFGGERALAIVRKHRADSARRIVAHLFEAVRSFVRNDRQVDDVTALILKVTPR